MFFLGLCVFVLPSMTSMTCNKSSNNNEEENKLKLDRHEKLITLMSEYQKSMHVVYGTCDQKV